LSGFQRKVDGTSPPGVGTAAPLLADPDVERLADVAHLLTTGVFGQDLAAHGNAILSNIGAMRSSEAAHIGNRTAAQALNRENCDR
jgi:hypothetical protein